MVIYLCQKRAVKWLCYSLFIFVGGCPDIEITRPKTEPDSVSLFATHLYPLIKKYQCANCHMPGVGQDTTSDFAINDIKKAHDLLLDQKAGALVDLDNPSGSDIVQRGPRRLHNCPAGVTCDIVANSFIIAIEKWRKGLGDTSTELIQTHYLDITAVTADKKTIWYDLRHLVQGGARQQQPNNTGQGTNQIQPPNNTGQTTDSMLPQSNTGQGTDFMQQPPTQQFSQVSQQIFTGLGECPPNINICLKVDVHKSTDNARYFISRFEVTTDTAILVKNGSSLLNGQATNNFSSADCVVQQEGFNFLKENAETSVIINKNVRQQMLAFKFKQLRLTTASDVNYCIEKKQEETGPLRPAALLTKYCTTGGCHTGAGAGADAPITPDSNKARLLGGINDRGMPTNPIRNAWDTNNKERNCLISWLRNENPLNC